MKQTAVVLLALFLLFSLSFTAFASPQEPYEGGDPVDGYLNDEPGYHADDEAAQAPEMKAIATEPTSDATQPAETQSGTDTKQTDSQEATPNVFSDDLSSEEDNSGMIVGIVICATILLVLLIIIAVLLLRKKRPVDQENEIGANARGIPLHIEVLSGVCYNAGFDFRLRRNLTIGTDKGCDLVFEDAKMQPMHAVINVRNGVVTLEEASAVGVTYIDGMKIFAPNRLRSGDIVTIGSTTFSVTFEEN